jgi:hypothetical protein
LREDQRARPLEYLVSRDVIDVIVGVDYEFNRKTGYFSDLGEHLFGGIRIFESIDDRYAVVTDDESGVGARVAFGVVDGGPDVMAEGLEREGQGIRRWRGWGLSACDSGTKQNGSG